MASFKEIKKRINSIKSTRKTTSAMKMVSSAKLRKAETTINYMLPYAGVLTHVMESLLTGDYTSYFSHERPISKVAVIAFSSDSSLCGTFNSNVGRKLQQIVQNYRQTLPAEHIFVYTVGKKVYDYIRKTGIPVTKNFENLAGKADYATIAAFAESLMEQFLHGEIDRVELLYHHFKSTGIQLLVNEPLLPINLTESKQPKVGRKRTVTSGLAASSGQLPGGSGQQPGAGMQQNSSATQSSSTSSSTYSYQVETDYILEPSREALLKALIPKSIKLQLYTALLDSNTSEHAARMIAMQTATDNANDLVSELTIELNKSRQQAITNELLDLASGAL